MSQTGLAALDEQKFGAFHWRTTLTTGLGVFCDGYDLTSIGLVLPMVLASFGQAKLTSLESATLAASALVGAAVGALIFGVLGQSGRKRFYGFDVLTLGVAAAAQAFAPSVGWLIAIRFVLGLGIGGDYVLSPVIMAEHANRADRGRALGLGFGAMWPLGALAAALMKLAMDLLHVAPDLQWRLILSFGAVPALSVLYLRRTMPETARYLAHVAGAGEEASRVIAQITGEAPAPAPALDTRSFWEAFAGHARPILSAALLWMIYDLVVYSVILFGPSLIARSLSLGPVGFSVLLQVIFILPASVLMSLFVIDRLGRKPLQVWGFVAGAAMVALFAAMQGSLKAMPIAAFCVYGLFNVALTGPGLVSGAGILGAELAPTRVRSVAQAITVAGGRIGAAVSSFYFSTLFKALGPAGPFWMMAGLSVLGAILTQVLVPETGRISLETLTEAPAAPAPQPA